MLVEEDIEAPRAAAEERTEVHTNEWLDRVEALTEGAHAALLGSERGYLLQFTSEIQAAYRDRAGLAATPAMTLRMQALRKRLNLVRSMLRQASAFLEAREQLEGESILGYTPRGLERKL
jgi:hypothetical protein